MKATDLLIRQHRELDQLFDQLDRVEEDDRKIVLEQLARTLVAHTTIEEETMYPAMKETARREVEKAYVEHSLANYALAQLLSTKPGDGSFEAKAMILEEVVRRHVEREEREILPRAEAAIGSDRLAQMGEMLQARFEDASQGYRRLLTASLAKNAPGMMMGRGRGTRAKVAAKKRAAPARSKKEATPKRATGPQRRGAPTRGAGATQAQAKRGASARKGATQARGGATQARGGATQTRGSTTQTRGGSTTQTRGGSTTQARGSKGTRGRSTQSR